MASPTSTSSSKSSATSKMLKEHLQEQQEPFSLNIYFSEREYLVKCLSSNGRNGCCEINLLKNLNKKMLLLSTKIVKSIIYRLTSANDSQLELSCCSDKAHQDEYQIAETNGFTEVKKSRLTPLGDSPDCFVEELPSKHRRPRASILGDEEEKKTLSRLTDETWQRKCTRKKHFNLMSVLNNLSSDEVQHIISREETLTENGRGNFIFTTFPWKSLGKSLIERYSLLIGFRETKEIIQPCPPRHQTNKDLVNHPSLNLPEKSIRKIDVKNVRNKYNYIHWFIGVENLGKLIRGQQTYTCRKSSRDLSMGFSNTAEEWNYSRKVKRKISFELGDTITDDIVEETIYLLLQQTE